MIGNAFILDNYTNIFDKALDYKQYFHYELNSKTKVLLYITKDNTSRKVISHVCACIVI